MSEQECLFCKFSESEIPVAKIFEDQDIFVIADIAPQAPTHLLLIPKKHYENGAEVAQKDPQAVAKLLAKAGELAQEKGLSGYRLTFNTGAEAGQTVFHAHLHLMGGRTFTWPPG